MHIGNMGVASGIKAKDLHVIVYSGGKTGSSSLYKSFSKITKCIQLHTNTYLQMTKINDITAEQIINYHYANNHKLLIVSCYREPISRRISDFFENINFHTKMTNTQILSADINKIIAIFLSIFNTGLALHWPHLDVDNKFPGGINIFEKPFDKVNGYQTYENEKMKVLMLRFDKIRNFESIIQNNTIYKNFKLLPDNVSGHKWYNAKYQEFKKKLVIPQDIIDNLFEKSPEKQNLAYFYDPAYINQLKRSRQQS